MEDIKKMRLQIAVRLRPTDELSIITAQKRILSIKDPNRGHSSEFLFDSVFGSEASQEDIFQQVGDPLVENVLQGYNACCFAYGQTGSGKTYSMYGKETGEWEARGLIPRAAEKLFQGAKELESGGQVRFSFFVSLLEIYLEHVRDLGKASKTVLPASGQAADIPRSRPSSAKDDGLGYARESLDIQEDTSGATFVKDLTYIEVKSVEDIVNVLKAGYSLRQTASTAQNDVSSRSHTVWTITVVQYPRESGAGQPKTGRLNMVDLAGSERLKKSHSSDVRLQEAKAINTSLTALGKVVMSLSQEGDRSHVPFRDSKLTRILKESLNGSSYTTLLANLNPTSKNYEECFNTLQFALRCSSITTVPQVNIVTSGNGQDKIVEQLTFRVAQLTEEMETLHAHYQKLIEEIAGPGYTHDMGPLERGMSVNPTSAGTGRKTGEDEVKQGDKSSGGIVRETSLDSSGGWRNPRSSTSMVEAEKNLIQQQLDLQKVVNKECDLKLKHTKQELSSLQVRLVRMEQRNRDDARSSRQRYKDLQQKSYDERQAFQTTIEDLRSHSAAEKTRLTEANENLRTQLDDLVKSVGAMTKERAQQARQAEDKGRKQQEEFENRYKMMAESISEQTVKNMETVQLQSSQFLKEKVAALKSLQLERDTLERDSIKHVSDLRDEVKYLLDYNESLWLMFQKMERNEYPVRVVNGIKCLRIPPKDRPEDPTESKRVQRIKRCSEKAQGFVASLIGYSKVTPSVEVERKATTIEEAPTIAKQASKEMTTDQTEHSQSQLSSRTTGTLGTKQNSGDYGDVMDVDTLQREVEDLTKRIQYLESEEHLQMLREELREEHKDEIEEEVISDLKSHDTVQYINSLEVSVDRYRETVSQERKRNQDLMVSLRSAQRTTNMKGNRGQLASRSKRPASALTCPGTGQSFRKILGLSSDRPQSAGLMLSTKQFGRSPLRCNQWTQAMHENSGSWTARG